jgi:polysaccharide biosynthesis protein PslG
MGRRDICGVNRSGSRGSGRGGTLGRKSRVLLMISCFLLQSLAGIGPVEGHMARGAFGAVRHVERGPRLDGVQKADSNDHEAVPPSIFSMTVQSGIFKDTPWPPMPISGIRLWDTFTNWSMLEPSRGTYDWPALDRWLEKAKAHGVDVLFTFGGTPTWASSNPTGACDYNPGGCYAPANMQDWDDFVRAIATHSAGRIKYWELWNEANQHEYWSGGIPALVTMAQHASTIIKSVDPSAEIFTPSGVGGATDTSTFLDKFLAAGGGQFVDGVAFHGYVNSVPSLPEDVNRIVDALRGVMAKRGLGSLPLWDTESSWGQANHLPNEDDQVAFVARHYILQWSKGVQRDYWYAWNDEKTGTLWDIGTRKIRRAGIAYSELARWLTGAEITAPCVMAFDSTWTCGFTLRGGTQAQVVWNSSVSSISAVQFRPNPKYVQYWSLDGKIATISGGSIQIGNKPLLLVVSGSHSVDRFGGQGNPASK